MVQYHFKTLEGPGLGPIGADEFRQRQEAGEINDETMVWRSGMLDWTTFANLRAIELRATQPRTAQPPPLPVKAAAQSAPRQAVQFLACGSCGQDWPENLLTLQGTKQICGNCQRRQKEDFKNGKLKNRVTGVSNGWGVWLLKTVGLAIVCGGLLFAMLWLRHQATKGSRILPKEMVVTPRALR